ncbi:unnamed protein product [Notodromas monacha]|uniref:SET domain-containing protein n=1 Tax=Notodromas monacha TaxID=399045 RepID=A0A7R9C385_9CRUS|nr:unnamed protein product [Notodromas monacha]CAG0925361.1 unnamed protein product [Notodromas monacha]
MKSLPEDAPEFPTKSADASGKLAGKVKGLDSEVSVSQDANSEIQEKSVLVRSREVSLVKERSGKETSNDQLNSNVSPPVIETVSVEFEEPAEGDSHFQSKFPIGKNVVLLPDDGKCSGKAKKKSYRKAAVGNERETPSKSSLVHDSDLSRETEGFKSIAAVKDSYPEVENKPGHSSSNHSNMSIGRGVVETCAQTSTASGEDGILSSGCRKTPDIPPGFEQLTTETRTPPLKAIEKFFSQNVSVEEFLNGSSANDEINYPRSVRKLSVSSSSNQSNTCDEVLCKTGTPATKPKSSTRQETSRNLRVTSGGGDGNPRTSTTTNSIKIADEFPLFVPKSSNKEAHARSHRRGRRKDSSAEQHLSMLATRFRLGRLAAGLYPDLKRFEHSCDPNSLVTECFGDVLVVRAVKRIEKGDRITMAFSGEKGEIKK